MNPSPKLALFGGPKAIERPFAKFNRIGKEEVAEVESVIAGGKLSQFLGRWSQDFYGGPKVREFEAAWAKAFQVKHAVSVNSATSALIAAVGAIGIEPGDEVIVPPWTMCASATAILHWNALPVFADIERETFCIDPLSIEANITPYTKAIMAVDIMGHSAEMDRILAIAKRHGLQVISDSSQAPSAKYKGRYAGTLAEVGVFSLNYHKHIHTGEGGIAVTDSDEIAERMRLIRNHAEAVVGDMETVRLDNMLGHNFRLGEIESAIGIEQLKKLPAIAESRQRAAQQMSEGLRGLAGLRAPVVQPDCTHVYYMYPMIVDTRLLGIDRQVLFSALVAEGIEGLGVNFANIHLLPIYQQKIAYGASGFPWNSSLCRRPINYSKGICPVAEELQDSSYLGLHWCAHELDRDEVDLLIAAFRKVWSQLDSLGKHARP